MRLFSSLLLTMLLASCNPMEVRRAGLQQSRLTLLKESRKGLNTLYIHTQVRDNQPSITVTLQRAESDPGWDGNVFIGTRSDTTRRLTPADLAAEWLSDDSIMIRHSTDLEVVKREQLVQGVHIVYDTEGR